MRAFILSFLVLILFSCSEKKKDPDYISSLPERFGAITLRGESIVFNNPEAGIFKISDDQLDKLLELDENGNPKYSTSEIIKDVYITNKGRIENNCGLFISFIIPKINDDDYVIIKSVIIPPEKVIINGNEFTEFETSYKFSSENSRKREYVYLIFSKEYNELKIPGKWKIELYNHNKLLSSEIFTFYK